MNYKLRDNECGKITKEFEPLFCLAISAKRYVLFNIGTPSKNYPKGEKARRGDGGQRGKTILRKISGHGLGGLRQLKNYDPTAHKLTAPEHIAAPLNEKKGEEARRLEAAFERGEAGISEEDVRAAQRGRRNYRDLAHGSTARLLCDI